MHCGSLRALHASLQVEGNKMFGTLINKFFSGKKGIKQGVDGTRRVKYCPECGDEYRADFSTCAQCGVALTNENIRQSRELVHSGPLGEISPSDELVSVKQGVSLEMKQYKKLLAKHGVPSMIYADQAGMAKG